MDFNIELFIHALIALSLGSIIGLERQLNRQAAGLHTNALVSLGSACFVILGILLSGGSDNARVASQVVTGIGFLCAGVIMRDGLQIRGINTAATLWCAAGVGALCGAGFFMFATTIAILILITNMIFHWLERKMGWERNETEQPASNQSEA